MPVKNIKQAIRAEKHFSMDVATDPCNRFLIDYISPYGYTNLQEYYNDKFYYQIQTANIPQYECTPSSAMPDIIEHINAGLPGFWIPEASAPYAWHCTSEEIDKKQFTDLGLEVIDVPSSGGTIVADMNDIGFAMAAPISLNITAPLVTKRIFNFLQTKASQEYQFALDSNDILLNNKKILGYTACQVNGLQLYFAHISLSDQSKLLAELNLINQDKEPGYIPENLFTRSEIINELISWFKED